MCIRDSRYWGSYTEGVSFALLFMNLWVPFINDLTRQTPYGYVKPCLLYTSSSASCRISSMCR